TITINTKPGDAVIKIDNVEAGRGPLVQRLVFNTQADVHTVSASRLGYKDASLTVTADYDKPVLLLELKPVTKMVYISVQPMAANISVDGKPLDQDPVNSISKELE